VQSEHSDAFARAAQREVEADPVPRGRQRFGDEGLRGCPRRVGRPRHPGDQPVPIRFNEPVQSNRFGGSIFFTVACSFFARLGDRRQKIRLAGNRNQTRVTLAAAVANEQRENLSEVVDDERDGR
jgi:hypothetical protein